MGMCSYCLQYSNDECFGWHEARGCCGITGPAEPQRPRRKAERDAEEAKCLREEADALEAETAIKAANKRRRAEHLDREAAAITRQLTAS